MEDVMKNAELALTQYYESAVWEPAIRMYRWKGNPRRYFTLGSDEKTIEWFLSVTTVIDSVSPTSSYLIEWIAKHGVERARQIAKESADYGTLMHIMYSKFLMTGEMDIRQEMLEQYVSLHVKQEGILYDTSEWAERLKKDMLSFAEFCFDFQLHPVAIECVLPCIRNDGFNPDFRIAGAIDFVGYITVKVKGHHGEVYKSGPNKGQPKESHKEERKLVIIDWKSCRKGFYSEHEIQLEIYRKIWNSWFTESSDLYVRDLYNFRPTEWRGSRAGYHFKNQTGLHSEKEIAHIVGLSQERLSLQPGDLMRAPDRIVLREQPEVLSYVKASDVATEIFADVLPRVEVKNEKAKSKKKSAKKKTKK